MAFIWLVEGCFGVNGSWFGCGSLVSDYLLELWLVLVGALLALHSCWVLGFRMAVSAGLLVVVVLC